MGNLHFIKGGLKQFNPRFLEWDTPKDREVDGRTVKGRPTRGFGNREFEYAGKLMTPEPWNAHDEVHNILVEANRITQEYYEDFVSYNFCLVGLYRNGSEGIPFHSDTVPYPEDLVFSVSFGATRLFEWREYESDIKDHSNTSTLNISRDTLGKSGYYYETKRWLLEHGDIILFDGASQMNSEHAVPELLGQNESRVNLTFRSGL